MTPVAHDNPVDFAYDFYQNEEFINLRLLNHSRDHEAKVTANISGLLTSLIAPTHAAVNAFSLSIGAGESELGIQRGKTSLKDIMLMDFVIECRFHFPVFKNIFRLHPEIMLEFMPHGMDEFNHLTTEQAEVVIHRVATACHAHEADITVPVATIFYNFDTNYPIARSTQTTAMGAYVADVLLIRAARKLLIKILVGNTGFIINAFSNDRGAALALFDYSKLYIHHSSPHQYVNIEAIHDADTNVPEANVITGKRVSGNNSGDGPVIMSIGLTAGAAPGVKRKVIQAHKSASALADDIRNDGGQYLNFHNANLFDIHIATDIYDV